MMFDDDLDFELFGDGTVPSPKPTHCNVPLTNTNARTALGKPSLGQRISPSNPCKLEYQAILRVAGQRKVTRTDLTPVQEDILNHFQFIMNSDQEAMWQQQLRVGELLNAANLKSVGGISSVRFEDPHVPNPTERAYLKKYYATRLFLENGVMMSGSETQKSLGVWEKTRSGVSFAQNEFLSIYVTENLCLIDTCSHRCLASRDHLLILSDLAAQRYIIRLLMVLESESVARPLPSLAELDALLLNGDRMLTRTGNAAYNVIKTLEAESQCLLVGDIPVGREGGRTYQEVTYAASEEEASNCGVTDLLYKRREILQRLAVNPRYITEIFGLYRIWGHPTVDPLAGASALKKIATQVRGVNMELADKITAKFKEEFILRYIAREHKWPNIDVSILSPYNIIRQSYEEGGVFPLRHPNYRRNHLNLVKFDKTFEVDPKFDLIEMIADKAMSLLTPDLLDKLRKNQGVGNSTDRSVLINWLKSPHIDPKRFLQEINDKGFSKAERSVGTKEKERELKMEARLFGLMTFFKRMYIVLTEAMLAEHILPYFPEITMVDDEISLDKKRLNFNSKRLSHRSLFTSLDFQKWNSYMREHETLGVFQCLDQLFGFDNVYSRTHEMFDSSFIYLLNGSYLPSVENDGLRTDIGCWIGHLGGIEGLRQKGWTLWTVTLILLASEGVSVVLNLMGQGDNQVLREIYPEHFSRERMRKEHFKLMRSLDDILKKIGPPLKVEETWTSENLYVYGKYTIYKGAALPMTLKRAVRIFRLSNEDYPTIESTLSSQTANLSAATASRDVIGQLYFVYAAEAVGALQLYLHSSYLQPVAPRLVFSKDSLYQGSGGKGYPFIPALLPALGLIPDYLYMGMMLLPRCFGGFPVSTVYHALIRGFPDDVSFAISSLKAIYPHLPRNVQDIVSAFLNPRLSSTRNFSLLFEQPTSINIDAPPAPGESRRNKVVEFLKTTNLIQNPYFKTFMNMLDSNEEAQIVNYLSSARPFNPRLLGLIASATTTSRARHIAGKLQKTVTISKIAREVGGCDIYSVVQEAELRQLSFILQVISKTIVGENPWTPEKCSLEHAQTLRQDGWGVDITGVDCVPPQEFMYFEFDPELNNCPPWLELDKGKIIVRLQRSMTEREWKDPLVIGDHQPYRGSVTRQKVRGFGDQLASQAEPFLQKALRTATLIGWGVPRDGNLDLLIRLLIHSKTDLPSNLLVPEDVGLTGSLHHRLQDDRTDHGGAVSVLPNFGSRFSFDTFPLTAYSKGSSNVNLMFQSVMSLSTALFGHAVVAGWVPSTPTSHVHVKSSCCVREVDDTLVEAPYPPTFQIQMFPDNPFLYTKKEDILGDRKFRKTFPLRGKVSELPELRSFQNEQLIAEEIIAILKPLTWEWASLDNRTHKVPINWVLKASLLRIMEQVALRLSLLFLGSSSYSSWTQYMLAISTKVERSGVGQWAQLDNLVFCPNASHEMASAPYRASLSGNPCLTPHSLGGNLKRLVAQILRYWGSSPNTVSEVTQGTFVCSARASVVLHPALAYLFVAWGRGDYNFTRHTIRRVSSRLLGDLLDGGESLNSIESDSLAHPNNFVLAESPDNLCKVSTYYPAFSATEVLPAVDLPDAVTELVVFSARHLRPGSLDFQPLSSLPSKNYSSFKTRIISKPTSGPFKGLSLFNSLRFSPRRILCLGDGSGGYTLAAGLRFPDAQIIYNSLITSEVGIQQAPPIPFIPALACYPSVESRVTGLDLVNEMISDFTHPQYPALLSEMSLGTVDLLISDAESPNFIASSSGIILAFSIRSICAALRPKVVLFKTYVANPSVLLIQISILASLYDEVKVLRSSFSTSGNTEVFLKGSGLEEKKVPSWNGHFLSGLVMGHPMLEVLRTLGGDLVTSHSLPDPAILSAYNTLLEPDLKLYLTAQMLSYFPMILVNNELIYPHTLLEEIRRTTLTRTTEGPIPLVTLKTYKIKTAQVKKWTMAWMTLMILALPDRHPDVGELWKGGYALWYRLGSGEDEFSLTRSHPYDWRKLPHCRYWKLSRLLASSDLKVLHRMVGVIESLVLSVIPLSSDETRGGWTRHGGPLSSHTAAESTWVRENVQQRNIERPLELPASMSVQKLHKTWTQSRSRMHR